MGRPAGFWLRFIAFVIDALILCVVNWVITIFVGQGQLYTVLATLIGWLYFAGFESSTKQATFGKQVLHLRATDISGNPLTFGRATGRYFAKILSSLILMIGYIMIAFTERKQGLHDMVAGTLVVKSFPESSFNKWQNEDTGYKGD